MKTLKTLGRIELSDITWLKGKEDATPVDGGAEVVYMPYGNSAYEAGESAIDEAIAAGFDISAERVESLLSGFSTEYTGERQRVIFRLWTADEVVRRTSALVVAAKVTEKFGGIVHCVGTADGRGTVVLLEKAREFVVWNYNPIDYTCHCGHYYSFTKGDTVDRLNSYNMAMKSFAEKLGA